VRTSLDMATAIGRRGSMRVRGSSLGFFVDVVDVRERFGQTDYLVTPVAGSGTQWVAAFNVTLEEAGQ
jgi:hypothetical protein